MSRGYDYNRMPPHVAIPLAYAFVCMENHVFDARSWFNCPSCGDGNAISLDRAINGGVKSKEKETKQ